MSYNKKALVSWVRGCVDGAKRNLLRHENNLSVIQSLKKGTVLTSKEFMSGGHYKVTLLMENGISMIHTKASQDYYVPWKNFLNYTWKIVR